MLRADIKPRVLTSFDSSFELYKDIKPEEWHTPLIKQHKLEDPDDYRVCVYNALESLLHADLQYLDQQRLCTPAYSLSGIETHEIYRYGQLHKVLSYKVYTVFDKKTKGFFCFTDAIDNSLRPLHKEYEIFVIENVESILVKQYYKRSFLLALQRTCYLWLLAVCRNFELKGSLGFDVRWSHSNSNSDTYKLFSAAVHMEFDLTQTKPCEDGFFTGFFDLKLSLPEHFRQNKILKSRFKNDQDFYDKLWEIRYNEITDKINAKYPSLVCTENISDIK